MDCRTHGRTLVGGISHVLLYRATERIHHKEFLYTNEGALTCDYLLTHGIMLALCAQQNDRVVFLHRLHQNVAAIQTVVRLLHLDTIQRKH